MKNPPSRNTHPQETATPPSPRRSLLGQKILAVGLLVLLTVWVYRDVIDFDYVRFDDTQYIWDNDPIKKLDWNLVRWAFGEFYAANWHPLTWISHALDWHLFGFDPAGAHLVNAALHMLNAVLVFCLFFNILAHARPDDPPPVWASLAAAVAFAVHPLRAESVAWISERKDVLFSFFYLLGLNAYWAFAVPRESAARPAVFFRSPAWWTSFVCFVLSMLSKPMAVSFPVVLLITDYFLGRRDWKHMLREKAPHLAAAAAVAVLTLLAQGKAIEIASAHLSFSYRVLNAFVSLGFYLERTLIPYDLCPVYMFQERPGDLDVLEIVSGLATGLLLTLAFIIGKRALRASILFYLVTLLPVLGLIKVGAHVAADRYTYIPTLVVFLWMSYGIVCLAGRIRTWEPPEERRFGQILLVVGVLIVIAWLVVLARPQIGIWRNTYTLWEHQVRIIPKAAFFDVLGDNYYHDKRYQDAIMHYLKAIEVGSRRKAEIHVKIALCYIELRRGQDAMAHLCQALEADPNCADAYIQRNFFFQAAGQTDLARQDYDKAVRLKPSLIKNYSRP